MNRTLLRLAAVAAVAATLLTAAACRRAEPVGLHRANGDRYVAEKKFQEALIEYQVALQADPRVADLHYKVGELQETLGNRDASWREYVRAADLDPSNIPYQLKAATGLWLTGQNQDAKTRAENVLALDPKNVDAHILLGTSLAGLKDLDAAIDSLNDAAALDPTRTSALAGIGVIERARGRNDAAEAAFLKAVEMDPKSVNAQLTAAHYYWTSEQPAKAEEHFKQALANSPSSWQANRALANFYVGQGRPDEAGPLFEAIARVTGTVAARLDLADYRVRAKQVDTARTELQALAADPQGFAEATIRLAVLAYGDGHPDEAYKLLGSVTAKQPKNTRAWVQIARLQLLDKHPAEARKSAQTAVSADAKSVPAIYTVGLADIDLHDLRSAEKAFTEVLTLSPGLVPAESRLAEIRLASGDAKSALRMAEESARKAPTDVRSRVARIRGLIATGDVARAGTEVSALLKSNDNIATVHSVAGMLYFRKRDFAQAKVQFTRALQLDPSSPEALRGLSALQISAGDTAEARRLVEGAVAARPNDASLWMVQAELAATTKDLAGAEKAWRKAIELDPNQTDAYGALATLYLSQKRLDQALQELEVMAKRSPKSVAVHSMAAAILDVQGKHAEARKRYEQVIAIDPNSVVAANNLAWMYSNDGGNLDQALQLAQTAAARSPNNGEVQDTLGWIFLKKDLPQMAVRPLENAVSGDPTSAQRHYHLGLAYAKTSDGAKAREQFDLAIKLQPKFPEAEAARQALTPKN